MRQLLLFQEEKQNEFGGSLLKGKRKSRRPLSTKQVQHLVLKADGQISLLNYNDKIQVILREYADRHNIHIYETAVHLDHIHLAIKCETRTDYVRWIRSITAMLKKAVPAITWKFRPYTRNVKWGRDFKALQKYIADNRDEATFERRAENIIQATQIQFETELLRARTKILSS